MINAEIYFSDLAAKNSNFKRLTNSVSPAGSSPGSYTASLFYEFQHRMQRNILTVQQ